MIRRFADFHEGASPVVAVAIHNGHALRPEVASVMALGERRRLREEDPFTGQWTRISDSRMVVHRSRFEVDLNRPRNGAIYRRPADAWGLEVWRRPLPEPVANRSLRLYDDAYEDVYRLLSHIVQRSGVAVVYDLHTYNHRRRGPDATPEDPEANPEVNVGTGTMDRERWAPLVERFMEELRQFDFLGRRLDVRENVRFFGGNLCGWIHRTFPESVCALAIEFKKFFMDEWTGEPDWDELAAIQAALSSTVPGVLEALSHYRVGVA